MTDENLPDHPAFRTKHPGKNIFEIIFVVLAVFTLIELAISAMLEGGSLPREISIFLLVFFALVKAILVAGYFMHLFYEKSPFRIFLIAFVIPMFLALPVAIVAMTV